MAKQTDAAKDTAFDTWSESELKNYLDSYGFNVPQGSTKNEMIAYARNLRNWFKYGTTTPQGTVGVQLYVPLLRVLTSRNVTNYTRIDKMQSSGL